MDICDLYFIFFTKKRKPWFARFFVFRKNVSFYDRSCEKSKKYNFCRFKKMVCHTKLVLILRFEPFFTIRKNGISASQRFLKTFFCKHVNWGRYNLVNSTPFCNSIENQKRYIFSLKLIQIAQFGVRKMTTFPIFQKWKFAKPTIIGHPFDLPWILKII